MAKEKKTDDPKQLTFYTMKKKVDFDKTGGDEIDLPALEFWSPKKTGDMILGSLTRKIISKKFEGHFYVLDVSEEGEVQHDVGLPSHVLLNRRLDQVTMNSIVMIRFEGKKKGDASFNYRVKTIF